MEQEDEIVLCGLEHGQKPGIVQPEMLEIGMELEPAYARRLQAFQLALPRFVTGVQSAESRHFGVLALERDGVVVGRDDLPRRGSRAVPHSGLCRNAFPAAADRRWSLRPRSRADRLR